MILTQAPKAITLACSLFNEVTSLTVARSDGIYADCLIALAFGHLRTALTEQENDTEGLIACAAAIEGCNWLSDAVRSHVPRTLRAAGEGKLHIRLAADIVAGASNRIAHQMLIDCARSTGSDGLAFLSETVGELAEAGAH